MICDRGSRVVVEVPLRTLGGFERARHEATLARSASPLLHLTSGSAREDFVATMAGDGAAHGEPHTNGVNGTANDEGVINSDGVIVVGGETIPNPEVVSWFPR